jgi:hypothetical protein
VLEGGEIGWRVLGADAAFVGKRPTIHVCDIIVADDMFAL